MLVLIADIINSNWWYQQFELRISLIQNVDISNYKQLLMSTIGKTDACNLNYRYH